MTFTNSLEDLLALDCAVATTQIVTSIREFLTRYRRRGLVVGLSGGIDSTVTAALAVRAIGNSRVFGLLMPERQSEDTTLHLSRSVADSLGIEFRLEEITGILEAVGFYGRYDAAVRQVIPGYNSAWKSKIAIHSVSDHGRGPNTFSYFTVVAQSPGGAIVTERLPLGAYLEIVAATNFKQRARKLLEYYHADRLNYAVAGTPNRLEYDQGFFVKNGDGAADIKPIAHLYKSQVYQLAEFLGVPEDVRSRPPTTDTYSLPQTQEEFYFSVPYRQMDLCLLGKNLARPAREVAAAADLTIEQVARIWADIDRKRETTRYLHRAPVLIEPIAEQRE